MGTESTGIFQKRRGQAALEFLTTYGWAFLVILVMIGALSYFGVLDPSRFLPDKCIFGAGLGACTDSVASDSADMIRARVINSFGTDISVTELGVNVQGVASNCQPVCNGGNVFCGMGVALPAIWSANSAKEINITCVLAAGDKPKAHVILNYTQPGGTYKHTVEGDIQVKLSP